MGQYKIDVALCTISHLYLALASFRFVTMCRVMHSISFIILIFINNVLTHTVTKWGDVDRDWTAAQKVTINETLYETSVETFTFPIVCLSTLESLEFYRSDVLLTIFFHSL